ncbi:ArsR family transcriptional regulator [Paenibacillus terrae HPL-003]|uniref:ArsR family transcriptional regulator n=1 Tax=Paenibacillus terrae (strain HPL-003) TaxID=985665 RepID=G7VYM0_PAETH|nr:hypothetical protein [Paenibacillus terrae]AET59010.1 ArsR family transcriptional regulator [Paenibacillus terrae HPL-003]
MGKQAIELLRACIPTFQTLSEPYRQDILLLLSENGKMTANDITEHHYFLALEDSIQLLKNLVTTLERDCL